MAFVETFAPFFADFAVDATLAGIPAKGIFDNAYAEAFSGMVSGSNPVFLIPSSVAVARGDALAIGTDSYTVTGIEPDGTGMTRLHLEKP